MNSVHTTPFCFCKINLSTRIILSPMSVFLVASFVLNLPPESYTDSSPPWPSHSLLLNHSNYTWRRVQVMTFLIMQFSPTSCHFVPLLSKYSSQHPLLRHPESGFPLMSSETKFHSYKTTDKIIVLHILIFTFLDSRRGDKMLNYIVELDGKITKGK
jgi:hypothetical protein